jgi:cytochrome c
MHQATNTKKGAFMDRNLPLACLARLASLASLAHRALAALALGLLLPAVQASEEPTRNDAVKMVEKAVALHRSGGKDKALAAVNQKDGAFHKGELYVFAYDTQGVVIAHPVNAKLVGKNMIDVPDPDGKLYRKFIVETALAKGTGWQDYKYRNPESGRIEPKTTYFQKIGDVIYLCGVYQ